MLTRKRIEVQGIVQGVGFRPYVFRLAVEVGLHGHVSNTAAGATIEVEGSAAAVDDFLRRLPAELPPLAFFTRMEVAAVDPSGEAGFKILPSRRDARASALIAADVATCSDCLRELLDPADRRFGYPFINCTNCGPRFTIVKDIPYDRPATSMASFPMCAQCQREYDDPLNRRFHAQPNACWQCGPQTELWDAAGNIIATNDPVAAAASAIAHGRIMAVKGLGGFHLAANALDEDAICRLRGRKGRAEKPFAVMVRDLATAGQFCQLDELSRQALVSAQRPIVLLPRSASSAIAEAVAPGNRYLGLFLPYTPIHHLLLAGGGLRAMVMTSANLSEEPIAIDNLEAAARLRGLCDGFLVHNRDILLRCDDSVVTVFAGGRRHLRRSRGFVPVPVSLHRELPAVLAVGGELKNTVCVVRGSHVFLSQHIGDLEGFEARGFLLEAVSHLKKVLEFSPAIIAHDLHPDYFPTRWALQQTGVIHEGVQHHHAHIASCMAEHHLEGRVIGIACDGTGYGTDGKIWGGEVLLCDYLSFERAAHFAYVPLPGGEAAIHEPWRMAVSYVVHHFGRAALDLDLPFLRRLDPKKLNPLLTMIERRVNSPLTSSCGRLFDAVAALIGLRHTVTYEAQAAIELEMAMTDATAEPYRIDITSGDAFPWVIDTRVMFEQLIEDLRCGHPASTTSVRFHLGLVDVFARIACRLRERTQLNRVCLSGGTFQNRFLAEHLQRRLAEMEFAVELNSQVPAGDGGLSLGQAVVAGYRHSQ